MIRNLFFVSIIMSLLVSCSNNIKNTLGVSTSGPNEYRVGVNKTLETPPHFDLDQIIEQNKNNKITDSNLNEGQKSLLEQLN